MSLYCFGGTCRTAGIEVEQNPVNYSCRVCNKRARKIRNIGKLYRKHQGYFHQHRKIDHCTNPQYSGNSIFIEREDNDVDLHSNVKDLPKEGLQIKVVSCSNAGSIVTTENFPR